MLRKILATMALSLMVSLSAFSAEIPMDAKLDYNQGIDFYKLGMYERAIESFRSAIRTYPDYIDAYYNLGTILEYLRNYSEATVIFKQIYTRNPHDYEVIYKLANSVGILACRKRNMIFHAVAMIRFNAFFMRIGIIMNYSIGNCIKQPQWNWFVRLGIDCSLNTFEFFHNDSPLNLNLKYRGMPKLVRYLSVKVTKTYDNLK